jgi:hypothetical protein
VQEQQRPLACTACTSVHASLRCSAATAGAPARHALTMSLRTLCAYSLGSRRSASDGRYTGSSKQVTLCSGLHSMRKMWRGAGIISQAGDTRPCTSTAN